MFKSKHSGWTWDLKRTPFGGGGGGIVSAITDPISSAIGTDGSGGGALGALASIDPGPAIGSGLASVDKTVNDNIPGGWITVGALAAGGLALAYAPEVMALAASEGVAPEVAATSLGIAPVDVATGATVPLSELGVSTGTGLDAASTLGFGGTGGAGSASGIAATQSAAGLGGAGTGIIEGLAPTSVGMGGTAGAGSLAGIAGSEAAAGLGGSALGTGLTADQLAQYEAGTTPSSISANSVNNARKLAQSLMGNSLAGAAQNMAVGQNGVASAIPGIIRGNQTPFAYTAQQPIRNATTPDLAQLATLLKQV